MEQVLTNPSLEVATPPPALNGGAARSAVARRTGGWGLSLTSVWTSVTSSATWSETVTAGKRYELVTFVRMPAAAPPGGAKLWLRATLRTGGEQILIAQREWSELQADVWEFVRWGTAVATATDLEFELDLVRTEPDGITGTSIIYVDDAALIDAEYDMPLNSVEIANMALGHIGVKRTITALTDTEVDAQILNSHYSSALETALSKCDWPFARRRLDLTPRAGTAPLPWAYQFEYPDQSVCVRPIRIDDQAQQRPREDFIPFVIEDTDTGQIILCDVEEPTLIYTHNLTDPTKYPPDFSFYLSWVLAARIARPLAGGDKQMEAQAEAMANRLLQEAISNQFKSEVQPDPRAIDASWLRGR